MKVSEMGEFRLIELLAEIAGEGRGKQPVIGIGDDAAAWQGDASLNLATVDCLVQNVHFTLDTTTWKELGWKALAISLSDIAAMGGNPRYALVSLGLPGDTDVNDVADLYRGMVELGNLFDVSIVGGNISSSAIVFINTTVFGNAAQGKVLTRSAACPGDLIAITGSLGDAAAGLKTLKQKITLDSETNNALRQAFLRTQPRIAEGRLLVEQNVKAAIDISDGLTADLGHLCRASKVGARIEVESIPIHPAVKKAFSDSALEMALSGGEDYELLFTASSKVIEKVKSKTATSVTVIGQITADETNKIIITDKDGKPYKSTGTGWQHFAGRS